ncbi:MAG: Tyrosine recombinase XerC [Candidatus Rokubacteria bacterium]|nr:Tyrosine recombinase XerC [Candidatus Rokubacteria bacterium]
MKDSAAEFLRYLDLQRGASRHTLRGYATDLAEFRAFLSREGIGDLVMSGRTSVFILSHLRDT